MSNVIQSTDSQFSQAIQDTDQAVLVYFWASWCGPCKLVSPSVEWAANEYSDRLKVFKLEVDPNPEAVKQCQVEGVPALRIFKNSEMIASHEGAIGKQGLQEWLDKNL
ncbi:thioredoxin [Spirulina sp. CS-785/01]|uniref:thioredoxin family protein n=1 Tax=Spirulina sp. CS-785/01 TaxID=3021716 RepID=UPI00232BB825|nr:thioredoxin family protein [Spirulina sp. CS-785/01]MDB9313584.1 thioredoxin [Spirulina sp. CS-785/01]